MEIPFLKSHPAPKAAWSVNGSDVDTERATVEVRVVYFDSMTSEETIPFVKYIWDKRRNVH